MSWTIRLRDQPEYASGSALLAGVDQWTAAEIKLSVDGSDVLNVTAPWSAEWLKTARPRHCLWVEDELGRVTEWRIIRIVDGRGVGAQETTVEAESLLSELSRVLLTRAQPGGATAFSFNVYDSTPEQLYDQFVAPALTAEGLTHFAKGTITPTTPLTFAFERFSALELLTEICNRTTTERWVERDSSSSKYDIYVGTRGSAAPTVRTSFNRGNLQEYRRDRDSLTIATASVPTGKKVDGGAEKSTLGFAAWKVTAATGTTLTLADPGGGEGPIAFADQLNSLYAVRPYDGRPLDVTDSTATGQTVTLENFGVAAAYRAKGTFVSATGATSITLNEPSGTKAGDTLVAVIQTSTSGGITAPTGWSSDLSIQDAGQSVLFASVVRATGAPSLTFTHNSSAHKGNLYRFSPMPATGRAADTSYSTGAGATVTTSGISTSGTNTVIVSFGGTKGAGDNITAGPTSSTQLDLNNTVGGLGPYIYFRTDYRDFWATGAAGQIAYTNLNNGLSTEGIVAAVAYRGVGIGFSTGEHIQFVASSSGRLLTELTSPSGVATYGRVVGTVDDEELREERNWAPNPIMTAWATGNVPDGWTVSSATGAIPARRLQSAHVSTIFGGTVAGGISGSNPYTLNVTGFTPGRVIERSDAVRVSTTAGAVNTGATVSTGGTATITVRLDSTLALATGQAVLVGKANTLGSRFANALAIWANGTAWAESPSIRIRNIPGYQQVWFAAGVTYYSPTSGVTGASSSNVLALIGPGTTVSATGFTMPTFTWGSGNQISSYDAIYRGTYTMTADVTASVRVTPQDIEPSTAQSARCMIRWVSITLGPDSQVPPIDGSHGNRIWQRGNQQLRLFGTPPTTYSVRLLDLVRARTPGLVDADDKLELGGAVKLIDDQLGEVDLRIVELRLDATNPYLSTVTLANIPPRLAKLAVRDKYAPPTRPDPTPPVQKPAAEEPTAPEVTILAPSIGITTPEPITLVDGTWSIYG